MAFLCVPQLLGYPMALFCTELRYIEDVDGCIYNLLLSIRVEYPFPVVFGVDPVVDGKVSQP